MQSICLYYFPLSSKNTSLTIRYDSEFLTTELQKICILQMWFKIFADETVSQCIFFYCSILKMKSK